MTTPTPLELEVARERGEIIAKLEEVHTAVKELDACFDRFKENIGARIQDNEKIVAADKLHLKVLQTEVAMIMWILRGVATPILGAIGLSIISVLVWRYTRRG